LPARRLFPVKAPWPNSLQPDTHPYNRNLRNFAGELRLSLRRHAWYSVTGLAKRNCIIAGRTACRRSVKLMAAGPGFCEDRGMRGLVIAIAHTEFVDHVSTGRMNGESGWARKNPSAWAR
jgi:hypothetical protein